MKDQARDALDRALPGDDAKQCDAFRMLTNNHSKTPSGPVNVLDLGAGDGRAYDRIKKILPEMTYTGLDIEISPEVSRRKRRDINFLTYDGENIPFPDNNFDVIFCKQVLEHVRRPDCVIAEVARVLRETGLFVGSVSQLEPYHSHSIFNWTAYGLHTVLGDHGLDLCEIRPGIDGISLTLRRLFGKERFARSFGVSSIFNHYIDVEMNKKSVKDKNFSKLVIAGHIVFAAQPRA